MKMDAVYRETALPGSHNGLGSSAMLHNECRHMAAHLGTAGEKSSTIEDRPETAALRQVDGITHEADQTTDEDVATVCSMCTGMVDGRVPRVTGWGR